MGSPVSPVITDIFMDELENTVLLNFHSGPRLFHRFVDDIITVVKRTDAQNLFTHLNNQHPRIRFTMEEETNGSLPFMDVRFPKQQRGKLFREVYQKPMHTKRYHQFESHHPSFVKSGVISCLVNRAINLSSDQTVRDVELKRIQKIMEAKGYPNKFVRKNIKKTLNICARRQHLPRKKKR